MKASTYLSSSSVFLTTQLKQTLNFNQFKMVSSISLRATLAIMALSPAIDAAPRPVARQATSGLSLTQQLSLADT